MKGQDANDALIADLQRRVASAPRRPVASFDKPKTYEPATPSDIAKVEKKLGFALPPLLRRVYGEVADGGFGPFYGIYSLKKYPGAAQEQTLGEAYEVLTSGDWPEPRLLPIIEWGDAIWSCLDCRRDDGPMVTVSEEASFVATDYDLAGWLRAWLDGVDLWAAMFEPAKPQMRRNPFTGELAPFPAEIGKPKGKPFP